MGFPNGVQVVEIKSREAARARDLALHLSDLTFSKTALGQIPAIRNVDDISQLSLWRCAIYQFYKCFQHSESRVNLDSSGIIPPVVTRCDRSGATWG
jgi:hypothetical protein